MGWEEGLGGVPGGVEEGCAGWGVVFAAEGVLVDIEKIEEWREGGGGLRRKEGSAGWKRIRGLGQAGTEECFS